MASVRLVRATYAGIAYTPISVVINDGVGITDDLVFPAATRIRLVRATYLGVAYAVADTVVTPGVISASTIIASGFVDNTITAETVTASAQIPQPTVETTYGIIRTFTDVAGAVDDTTKTVAAVREDGAGLKDPAEVFASGGGTQDLDLLDLTGLRDSHSLFLSAADDPTDRAGTSDSALREWGWARTYTDSESLTDSLSIMVAKTSTQQDAASLSDTVTPVVGKQATDTAGIVDTVSKSLTLSAADSTGTSDSADRPAEAARLLQSSTSVTDTSRLDTGSAQSDGTGVSDVVTRAISISVMDTTGTTDLGGIRKAVTTFANSRLDLADASTSTGVFVRTVLDDASLTDTPTKSFSTSLSDTLGIASTVGGGATFALAFTDFQVVRDAYTVESDYRRNVVDLTNVTDSATRGIARDAEDSIIVVDTSSGRIRRDTGAREDDVEMTDVVVVERTRVVVVTDGVGSDDSLNWGALSTKVRTLAVNYGRGSNSGTRQRFSRTMKRT